MNEGFKTFLSASEKDRVDTFLAASQRLGATLHYLRGNINVYPLALDNTSWHDTVEFNSPKDAPVLEIRFMGLKGIFRYLLDEMTAKTGATFVHVDGESL